MQKNADQVEKDILETQSKLKKVKLELEYKKHAVNWLKCLLEKAPNREVRSHMLVGQIHKINLIRYKGNICVLYFELTENLSFLIKIKNKI